MRCLLYSNFRWCMITKGATSLQMQFQATTKWTQPACKRCTHLGAVIFFTVKHLLMGFFFFSMMTFSKSCTRRIQQTTHLWGFSLYCTLRFAQRNASLLNPVITTHIKVQSTNGQECKSVLYSYWWRHNCLPSPNNATGVMPTSVNSARRSVIDSDSCTVCDR